MTNPTLFHSGWIVTPSGPVQESLAVNDGVILGRGATQDVVRLLPSQYNSVDLRGGLLSPGFVDTHVHAVFGGMSLVGCSMLQAESAQACFDAITDYRSAHPDGKWISAAGWNMDSFPGGRPHRRMLDDLVGDVAVYATERGVHSAWVSSEALRLAGITAQTPDPADGVIGREADGTPDGMLYEGAMSLVADLVPQAGPEEYRKGLAAAEDFLFSHGITGWQDALLGDYAGHRSPYGTYSAADVAGELRASVSGSLWWDRERGLDQIDGFEELRAAAVGQRFAAGTVKMMLDGVIEAGTASVLEPYLDRCGHAALGHSFVDKATLLEAVTELDRRGFQVHFHALGDRAVRDGLDAVERARRTNGSGGPRHHMAHLELIDPVDLPRFRKWGLTANLQMLWGASTVERDAILEPHLGAERLARTFPNASLVSAGADLSAGSDWPVSTPNPLEAMHIAVNREIPADLAQGATPAPANRAEAIDLLTAWNAFTLGSNRVHGRDQRAGELRAGFDADLVVLDRNPFAAPPEEIASTAIVSTFVRGKEVYRRSMS